jgi:type IV secretory pathway VirB6-like protein
MKKMFKSLFIPVIAVLVLGSCSASEDEMAKLSNETQECIPLKDVLDLNNSNIHKIGITDPETGEQVGIITWLTNKIAKAVRNASMIIYLKVALNLDFRFLVGMMMTLAVLLFAGSVMLGVQQASGYNTLMFMLKLIIIYQLTINYIYFNMYVIQGFESLVGDFTFFSMLTFSDYISTSQTDTCLSVFSSGGCSALDIFNGMLTTWFGFSLSDVGIGDNEKLQQLYLFTAIDDRLSQFFDFRFWKIILALSATGITGIFWACMMTALVLVYLFSIIIAVKTYLMALIARYVLYGLGPLFISFALFNQTRSLFDGWIQQLINFTLQPVFLFIFLGMFHSILSGFMNQLYMELGTGDDSYDIYVPCDDDAMAGCDPRPCEECEGDTQLMTKTTSMPADMCIKYTTMFDRAGANSLKWYRLCSNNGENCDTSIKPMIPIDIWMVIAAIIVCYMMGAMCSWVTQIAAQLSSGMISLGSVHIQGWDRLKGSVKGGIKNLGGQLFKGGAPRN